MVFKANGTEALAENIRVFTESTLGGFGGFFYGNNLHIGVAVCDLEILFRVANLIATIGKHRMPFGGDFTFDVVKGLFVYFDQFNIHNISVEIVSKVAVWYLCICHSVLDSLPRKGLLISCQGEGPRVHPETP